MSCEYKVALMPNTEIVNKNESYMIRIYDERYTKILHEKHIYLIDLSCGYKLYIVISIFDIINFILTRNSIIVILTSFLFSILQFMGNILFIIFIISNNLLINKIMLIPYENVVYKAPLINNQILLLAHFVIGIINA
ncbi:hypothetical protein HZS_6185, partial [Henneguya salminicola]